MARANPDDLVVLGRTVRAVRLARGMSIDELTAGSGIAPDDLAALERGEHDPMFHGVLALADALGISARTLMREVERGEDASALFGQRLRDLRAERSISQDKLARRTGIHPTAIGRLERGSREPRLTTILRLASGLDLQPGRLLDDLGGRRLTPEGFERFGHLPTDGKG
jgi:transcriptional regulator with XRE-family HTH domain